MKKPALVILAAGMGSRYGGLKQMDPMDPMGHAIIDYSIYDAKRAGFGKVVFVIKKAIEKDFKETVGARVPEEMEVCYAYQEVDALPEGYNVPEGRVKPWGTAHAVLCAKPFINEPFAVINADDYYGVDGYKVMADFLTSHEEKDGKAPLQWWDIILEIQLQIMDTYPEVSVKLMTTTSYFLSQKELISKNVKIMQNSQKMTVQLGHRFHLIL